MTPMTRKMYATRKHASEYRRSYHEQEALRSAAAKRGDFAAAEDHLRNACRFIAAALRLEAAPSRK